LARALIVGCGCRGRELGTELTGLGWQVRGTSRRADGIEAIEAAGIEPAEADPDRPGTVLELCGDVAVVVWLLGSASGAPEAVSAIHGPRLERLLEKIVDTPVRGFAYEATGSVDGELLDDGRRIVDRAAETWRIPVTFLTSERDEPGRAAATAGSIASLLTVF
jgi:nucleoside-diphosphate-sugar epimerase